MPGKYNSFIPGGIIITPSVQESARDRRVYYKYYIGLQTQSLVRGFSYILSMAHSALRCMQWKPFTNADARAYTIHLPDTK